MNCLDARRALGAEPGRRTAELAEHLSACADCTRHAEELARFEVLLERALAVPVPVPGSTLSTRGPRRLRVYALAASGVLAALLMAALWSVYPREVLATALVGHLAHEPGAWGGGDVPVPASQLAYVLGRSHVRLAPGSALVSYAHSCWFRGWYVPHLVVQAAHGLVTVIVLRHERVDRPITIDEGGYRGVIVPSAGRGAVALLARDSAPAGDVEEVVARVAAAVRFVD